MNAKYDLYDIYLHIYIYTCHWRFTKVFSIKNVNLKSAYSTFNFQRYAINFVDYQSCPPFSSAQSQLCLTLCDPMECSTPGCPVHHRLPEFIQTHVHWVGNAIQPSHPLSSPFPPTFDLSQHQGLFEWVGSLHQVAKVLEFQLQHQSFQWIFSTDFLYDGLVGSPCSIKDPQESSPTPQFKSINSSALSFLYSPNFKSIHDYWKNHSFD